MGAGEELQALNLNMAMYHADLDYPNFFDPPRPLPDNPTIYFTVEPATGVPATWFDSYVNGDPVPAVKKAPSSATILTSTWVVGPAGAGAWSTPTVYMTYHDLGLPSSLVIDGLSVDIDTDEQEILLELWTVQQQHGRDQ